MDTDDYVDVLTVGSGRGCLAVAIAAVDAGLSVFVADADGAAMPRSEPAAPPQTWTALLQEQWRAADLHPSTAAYLDNLTRDLGSPNGRPPATRLPMRTADSFAGSRSCSSGSMQPFYGSDLQRWALDCLCAPYSMVLGRVSPTTMAELASPAGNIGAAVVAAAPQGPYPRRTLDDWLSTLAVERSIRSHGAHTLQRLLFSDGKVSGAILDTPHGPRVVRARRDVLIGTSATATDVGLPLPPMAADSGMRLCLVTRTASRFARLEFVTSEPVTEAHRPNTYPISRPSAGAYRSQSA